MDYMGKLMRLKPGAYQEFKIGKSKVSVQRLSDGSAYVIQFPGTLPVQLDRAYDASQHLHTLASMAR